MLKIESKSPGVTAKFSNDGKKMIVEGPDGSDVSVKFSWDDATDKGRVFKSIENWWSSLPSGGEKGNQTKSIKIGSGLKVDERILEQGSSRRIWKTKGVQESGRGRTSNIIFADYVQSFNDDNDIQIRCTEGIFTPSNEERFSKTRVEEPGILHIVLINLFKL